MKQSRRVLVFLFLPLLLLAVVVFVSSNSPSGGPAMPSELVRGSAAESVPSESATAVRVERDSRQADDAEARAPAAPTIDVPARRRVPAREVDRRRAREAKEAAAQEARARELIAAEPAAPDPAAARLVPVVITFESGVAPDLARVHYTGARLIGSAKWRPGRPVVGLRPGKHRVWVEVGDLGQFRSKAQEVEVVAGVRPTIRVRLRDTGAVVGRLVFPAGETAARLPTVYLQSATADLFDGAHSFVALPGDFAFRFHDLPSGRYVLTYGRVGNGDPLVREVVDVAGGAVRRDLHVPRLRRDEYVLVRVVGPDGEGIDDAVVRLGALGEFGIAYRSHPVAGGDGGVYKALSGGLGELKAGERLAVIAMTRGHGRRVETIPRAEQLEVTVRMLELATVDVEVAPHGPSRDTPTRFAVELASVREVRPLTRRPKKTFSAARGARVMLAGVQPGEYLVVVLVQRPDRRFVEVSRQSIALASGSNSIVVSAPELHPVEVDIRQKAGSALLYRAGDPDPWRQGFTDDGVIEFHGVPAGSYEVIRADGRKRSFDLPTSSVVKF